MKFFQKVNMASESIASYNRTGKYQVNGTNTAVSSGEFVFTNGLATNAVYGKKDINVQLVKAPVTAQVTASNAGVYVVDYVGVSTGTINGNDYRIGVKTAGLQAPAGTPVAIRQLSFNDEFYLGDENFVSAPNVGTYAILTNGNTALTPSSTIPSTGFTVKVEESDTLSQGLTANITAYLCTVVQL